MRRSAQGVREPAQGVREPAQGVRRPAPAGAGAGRGGGGGESSRLVFVQEIKSVQKFTFKNSRLRSVQFSSPSDFVQVQFKKSVQFKKVS